MSQPELVKEQLSAFREMVANAPTAAVSDRIATANDGEVQSVKNGTTLWASERVYGQIRNVGQSRVTPAQGKPAEPTGGFRI
jgi:hypothetical protein